MGAPPALEKGGTWATLGLFSGRANLKCHYVPLKAQAGLAPKSPSDTSSGWDTHEPKPLWIGEYVDIYIYIYMYTQVTRMPKPIQQQSCEEKAWEVRRVRMGEVGREEVE